jgi:hypothetical protein
MLGLDVANQIIFISKNGEEKYLKIKFFFHFPKKKNQVAKICEKKNIAHRYHNSYRF